MRQPSDAPFSAIRCCGFGCSQFRNDGKRRESARRAGGDLRLREGDRCSGAVRWCVQKPRCCAITEWKVPRPTGGEVEMTVIAPPGKPSTDGAVASRGAEVKRAMFVQGGGNAGDDGHRFAAG